MVSEYFYSKEKNVIKCWKVKPNDLVPGFYILTDCKSHDGWCEVRPLDGSQYKEVITGKHKFYFIDRIKRG